MLFKFTNRKSTNSWAQFAITNPQILRYVRKFHILVFILMICKSQICKFCRWASPLIANPQIFHHKTERMKHLFLNISSLTAKLSTSGLHVSEFFKLIKILIRTFFSYVFVIWKKNCKFAEDPKCHTCGSLANVTIFVSTQICGFAICRTYLRTALLCKFANSVVVTGANLPPVLVDTGGKFPSGVVDTSGVPWLANITEQNFLKKFEMTLILFSGARKKRIHGKNLKQKNSWHCPFKAKYQRT